MFLNSAQIKKAAALLIGAALVISLAACGKDKETNTDSAKTENADTVKDGQGGGGTVSIVPFDDSDDDNDGNSNGDGDTVTTTTTTNTAKSKTTTAKKTTTKATEKTTTAKETTTTTAAAVKRDNSYKVVSKTYTAKDGEVTLTYPQITGLHDTAIQDFYNDLFKTECVASATEEYGLSAISREYEVTLKTADKLSIVFRGEASGGAHPVAYAYAYTIDLATGETVNPADSINMNKAADAIANDSWKLVRSADGVTRSDIIEYFNQFSEEEMKSYMTVKDIIAVKKNAKGQYVTQGKVGCNSYLNAEEKPVLILDVNHALGDYVEVKF